MSSNTVLLFHVNKMFFSSLVEQSKYFAESGAVTLLLNNIIHSRKA